MACKGKKGRKGSRRRINRGPGPSSAWTYKGPLQAGTRALLVALQNLNRPIFRSALTSVTAQQARSLVNRGYATWRGSRLVATKRGIAALS